jgi:hypothetical protein
MEPSTLDCRWATYVVARDAGDLARRMIFERPEFLVAKPS